MKAKLTIRAVAFEMVGDEKAVREAIRTLDNLFTAAITAEAMPKKRAKPQPKSGHLSAFDLKPPPGTP